MNKHYMLSVLSALVLSTLTSKAQETLALEVKFETTSPASIDGSYCGGNIEIVSSKIEPRNVTDNCFGVLGQITRSSLYFNGDVDYKNKHFAYILIKNQGNLEITKVVLQGVSHTGDDAFLTTEFSLEENPGEDDYDVDDNYRFPKDEIGVKCKENTVSVWLPDTKVIRLMHSTRYQAMNVANPPRPCIQSLQVWTNGTYTSVSKVDMLDFNAYTSNNELIFTESASQVAIYNISGQLVQTSSNTQTLSLNTLSTGIYVVKATSTTGKTLVTKIAK